MNIAELAKRFPNWRNGPDAAAPLQPRSHEVKAIKRRLRTRRKINPIVDDKLLAKRERKRKWYYDHKGTVLAKLKAKRDADKRMMGDMA
jgi:hypothetical protein